MSPPVWIFTSTRKLYGVTAFVDTGTRRGNWISLKVVEQTHPGHDFEYDPTENITITGETFRSIGLITLQWNFQRKGEDYVKTHSAELHVMESNMFQMTLGEHWCKKNWDDIPPLNPLVSGKARMSKGEYFRKTLRNFIAIIDD